MQIKRYEAASIQDALIKIKRDLGEDAVILSTKRLKSGKHPLIEVTAARDDQIAVSPPAFGLAEKKIPEARNRDGGVSARLDALTSLVRQIKNEDSLRGELAELKATLNSFFDLFGLRGKDLGQLASVYYRLTASGMSDEEARKLVDCIRKKSPEQAGKESDWMKTMEELVMTSIPPPIREAEKKKVLAFVGPTGVGKTTTLAKLAARYALGSKWKVGLITTDTYRIAAVEQLKVYGRIMGLPVEVASNRAAFSRALQKFSDKEAVLIDTPGRSQREEDHLLQIRDVIQDARVETHLLLSPTASRENMIDAASKFNIMNYSSVIFTKLDECSRFGPIYDVMVRVGKPIAYTTSGQNVPQDIEAADPGRIARLIVRNQLN